MKAFLKLYLLLICVVFSVKTLYAQQNNGIPLRKFPVNPNLATAQDTVIKKSSTSDQEDIGDVIARLRKRKPESEAPDSITSRPTKSIVPAIGYTLVSKLALVLSGNAAFRTGPNSRISTIVASTSYTQNKQFTLPIQTSIWTKDNRYNFVGDYRFYKYPQLTYGLGSNSNIANADPMDYSYIRFNESVYRHISGNFYAGLGYAFDDHYNISEKGNPNGSVSDYALYGKNSNSIASGFTFNALFDSRDNAINPSKGGYATIQYRDNYRILGSTSIWRSLVIDVRKYFRFPEGSDNVLALWSYNWLIISGRPAYLDLPSTEWDFSNSTGRGYIQGRFRGAQMVYGEAEYRFKLTDNGLLGGVVFGNVESFSSAPGTQLQRVQPAFGPGLRVKLNKLSNTNISIDYGFGRQGSNGLFIDIGEAF